jgi:mannosyltransferase
MAIPARRVTFPGRSSEATETPSQTRARSLPRGSDTEDLIDLSNRRSPLIAVIALTVVAGGLRAATIEAQSFWDDELFTVWLVRLDFGDMVRAWWDSEATPPVYYVVTWLWSQLFGTGEIGLRSLSVLAGTAAVPIVYLVGSRFASTRAGLAAATLATFNPFFVWYGAEARSYAFLVPEVALGLLLFLAALTTPSRRNLGGWAIVSALALATHYFTVFIIVPQAVWLLLALPRERRRAVLAAIAAPAVVGAAVLPILLHATGTDPGGFAGTSLVARTAAVPKNFLVGFQLPSELLLSVGSGLLALVLAAVVVLRARGAERRTAGVCAVLGVAAVGVPLLLAFAGHDYLSSRNVIAALIPALAAVGRFSTGTPAPPSEPIASPPGFRLVERVDAETYTLVRFRAPRPLVVTRETADQVAFKAEGHVVVTQLPH